jgi:hypothetical protein
MLTAQIAKNAGNNTRQAKNVQLGVLPAIWMTMRLDDKCTAYQQMKTIIKMAYLEGITVEEARFRHANLYSTVVNRSPS